MFVDRPMGPLATARRRADWWLLAAGAVALALGAMGTGGRTHAAVLYGVGVAWIVALCVAAFVRTDLLVPLIIVTTPLEITRVWIPFLRAPDWYGYQVSLLDAGRLAILLAGGVWALRAGLEGRLALPRDPIVVWAAALVGLALLSLAYTFDPARGRNEAIRLVFNLVLMVVVARFLPTVERLRGAVLVWVLAGVALSVVALWQWASGTAFWNPQLQTGAFRRVNGPFADPNTFASFLNVAAVFALNRLAARDGRPAPWLLGLCLLGAGLFVTFSRSGWLALAIVVVLWGLFLARTGRALAIFAVLLAAGAGVVGVVPSVVERLENLGSYESVSVRPQLIEVGLLIFREQPLTGLGIGSFQLAVATAYSYAYPFFWYVMASHTSFVTTAAELGIPGLLCTAGLLFTALVQAYLLAVDRGLSSFLRSSARALILAVVVLVVAGQTTGALFEEPYVWIALGMIVAVRRRALEEREWAGAR